MPENNINSNDFMEDISSTSKEFQKNKNPLIAYSNNLYKNLGNVIKVLSFALAFFIIIICFIAAFLLFTKTAFGFALFLAIILIGAVMAVFVFFPLFGLGHILCQNNEILKRLDK